MKITIPTQADARFVGEVDHQPAHVYLVGHNEVAVQHGSDEPVIFSRGEAGLLVRAISLVLSSSPLDEPEVL